MKRILCVLALLTIGLCQFASAQEINGKWKGTMESPNGAMEMVFDFKANADSLTGTIASPMGELPISNGKIDGKNFSFEISFNDMTIKHTGTIMADSISLKMPGMGDGEAMEMILKRAVGAK